MAHNPVRLACLLQQLVTGVVGTGVPVSRASPLISREACARQL